MKTSIPKRTRLATLALALGSMLVAHALADDAPFLKAPQYIGPAEGWRVATNRSFQGISSMAVTPQGRLWATWYGGPTDTEDYNNYVMVATSGDDGATWQEVLIIDPDAKGPVRAFDPEIWVTPDNRLFVFWAQAIGHQGKISGTWMVEASDMESAEPQWSEPRRLCDGIMMCKPLVLSTGEWALPAATWDIDDMCKMVVSSDHGKTWSVRGAANVPKEARTCPEHMFIERRDGSLWMLARTQYGIGESISTDRGKTWPEVAPSAIKHPPARFFISRLASGNLLLVKHGPIDKVAARSQLTAFLSEDDGHTWSGGLMLDERPGVSYPDGQQVADGRIHITYDFDRMGAREILMAVFREEDVAAGKPVSDAVRLRQVINKATGGQGKLTVPREANADGEPLRTAKPGTFRIEGFDAAAFVVVAKLFTDRDYTLAEVPEVFKQANFLRVPLEAEKKLTCERAGTLWFLTPLPSRNSDSQQKTLLDQGFKKVAHTEISLFNLGVAWNFCTLSQKDCAAGETITIGKWALPVFIP